MLRIDLPKEQRPFDQDAVLMYYDGPMLFWLPVPGKRMLAIALPDDAGRWPFLVSELREATVVALQSQESDLRQAVLSGINFLLTNYGADVLMLEPLTEVPEDWLPKAGVYLN
jgi:hypothetical protein